MIRAEAPGKLYIAGEYAVVNPGFPSVLVAVDRFIRVSIDEKQDEGTIISKQYAHLPLKWKRIDKRFVIEKRDNPYHYILEAIAVSEQYALELGCELKVYDLQVDSELDSEEGAKYGLGSSGAVTVATIRALFRLYGIAEDDYSIYKLASLAHLRLGSNGSFGDLAASVMTGWVKYISFDRKWVLEQAKKVPLNELIRRKWPSLLIERIEPLSNYKLIVGWTKSPASTASLVDKVKRKTDPALYREFLEASRDCVETMLAGLAIDDGEVVATMIGRNRELLQALEPSIETADLTRLIEIANRFGVAKTSGAGGGDCGIVLARKDHDLARMFAEWRAHGIEPLNLNVYDKTPQSESRRER